MTEQSIEQADIVQDEQQNTVTPPEELDEGYAVPRGAIAFGVLMILGYAFYFFMIWSEVIARAGVQ